MSFFPTRLEIPNSIISAYATGAGIKQRKEEVAQQKELELARLKQQRELEEERLSQEHEIAQKHIDLLSNAADLNRLIQGQTIAQKYAEGGVAPAGTQIETPQTMTPPSPPSQPGQIPIQNQPVSLTPGLSPDQVRLNIPQLGQFTSRTPQAQAELEGQLGTTREAPLLEKQRQLQEEIANRNMYLELTKADAANKLKQVEMESSERRNTATNEATRYRADTAAQASIQRALIAAQNKTKLSATQQRDINGLKDISDAIDGANSALGDTKSGKWGKWFNDELIDSRAHPTIGKLTNPISDDLAPVDAAFNTLENALAQHGKFSPLISQLQGRFGYTGSRQQTPERAKNNLAALKLQVQRELANIGSTMGKVSIEEDKHIYFDDKGNIIPNPSEKKTSINETIAERHNNPLNIKYGAATKDLVDSGIATLGEKAQDGGNFLRFKNPEEGLNAASRLLSSDTYSNLSVDEALKKWSNKGYGAELVKSLNLSPSTKIKDLSDLNKQWVIRLMARKEGFKENKGGN